MLPLPTVFSLLLNALPAGAADYPPAPPACADCNVVFISLGNVGARHMSLYGYGRRTTPKLERWASDALVFEEAFSHASWTLPAAASWLTGLYPYSHGVLYRDLENLLRPGIVTLPELLRSRGYRTAAFTGGLDYYRGFSTMRGFEKTDDNPNFTGFDVTIRQAKEWIARHRDEKLFLFLHGYDAHCPFTPKEPFRERFGGPESKGVTVDAGLCVRGFRRARTGGFDAYYAGACPKFRRTRPCRRRGRAPERVDLTEADVRHLEARYDEEVLSVDAAVGDFLSGFDEEMARRTVFVVFSEHGEMFAKHGRFGRAGTDRGTLYDDVLHVPLIIRVPGIRGRRVAGLAQLIDIMPTVARLVGVPLRRPAQGKDLSPMIRDGAAVNDYVFAGIPFLFRRKPWSFTPKSVCDSVRGREWKLIHESFPRLRGRGAGPSPESDRWELYFVKEDPDELKDLSERRPEVLAAMRKRLRSWKRETESFFARPSGTEPVPEELLREAEEHGYW